MAFSKVRKILLFRLCCLGDVTMLTPVITNLHNRFPDAEIKIAASKWIENLLPYLPVIKEAIVFDAPFNKNIIRKITGTIGLIFRLRKEKFDLVFLAHRNNVYGLILKLSGIRCRLGFSETKYINYPAPYEQDLHFVERHLNILSSNGMEVKTKNLSLIPKPNKKELLNSIGLTENDFIFGIFPFGGSNPGTQMEIKKWDYANYISLINEIIKSYKEINILFFEGYLNEEKIKEEFPGNNIKKILITNDLISICKIFISGDTGPLYIAEGFGVSTLSIFGPSDADTTAPKSGSSGTIHRHIWKKPWCSPCYNTVTAFNRNDTKYWVGSTFKCYTGTHECIKSVTVEEVKKEIEDIIKVLAKK